MRSLATAATAAFAIVGLGASPSVAAPFFFSTGNVDGRIATASRPASAAAFEIESADDFALTSPTMLNSATFTGLTPAGSSVVGVTVEIYRIFPLDSNVARTSGAPTFSTSQVPTRVNSPSDVALSSRDSTSGGGLTFSTNVLASNFSTLNSVQPGGIHPTPGQTTGGNGPVTGQEVEFDINFNTAFLLDTGHYFFVPQVQLSNGNFLWLSSVRPIISPGTPFPAGVTDLQAWTRDAMLDPDWLRVGTDIVGGTPAPTFNEAFSLTGTTVPEPASLVLLGATLAGLALLQRRAL